MDMLFSGCLILLLPQCCRHSQPYGEQRPLITCYMCSSIFKVVFLSSDIIFSEFLDTILFLISLVLFLLVVSLFFSDCVGYRGPMPSAPALN